MRPLRLLETCLYVRDLAAAERFYGGVLGLECIGREAGRHVFFRCGSGVLLLFDPERAAETGRGVPAHGAQGIGHAAFAVHDDDLASWRAHLIAHGVSIEQEVRWPAGGRSIYFRDPEGNSLELATPAVWNAADDTTGAR